MCIKGLKCLNSSNTTVENFGIWLDKRSKMRKSHPHESVESLKYVCKSFSWANFQIYYKMHTKIKNKYKTSKHFQTKK